MEWVDPASFQHSIDVFFEISKLGFEEVVDGAIKPFGFWSKRNLIYARTVWRELWNCFVFEDSSKLSVFEGDRSRSSDDCGCGFHRNIVRGEVRIEVNYSGESFFVASDIGNCEKKEFILLWSDSSDRKDSR